jgi:hypothetical protein
MSRSSAAASNTRVVPLPVAAGRVAITYCCAFASTPAERRVIGRIARTGGAHQHLPQPRLRLHRGVGLRGHVDFVDTHLAQGLGAFGAQQRRQGDQTDDQGSHWLQYRTFFPDLPRRHPSETMSEPGLTYRDAGVDIDAGDELVERIKPVVKRTMRKEVLAGIGGFGALVEVPLDRYRKPVLVSGTDGVGTKLRLAIDTGRHDKIGIDLVAMCANDIAVSGAEPLFFLDYYATASCASKWPRP